MSPQEINQLISFFESADLSSITTVVRLSKCEKVADIKKFVKSHIAYIKANPEIFKPYTSRLIKLKKIIENETIKH